MLCWESHVGQDIGLGIVHQVGELRVGSGSLSL
jgi:hypothetical protein